jgi:hypothetical protein
MSSSIGEPVPRVALLGLQGRGIVPHLGVPVVRRLEPIPMEEGQFAVAMAKGRHR